MNREEMPHEHDAHDFARELSGLLRAARLDNRFGRLVLVAEPGFLGMLRDALDGPTADMVTGTVGKDLGQIPDREVASHLGDLPV